MCCVLCIPFIRIYTRGITDIKYIYEYLPYLFCFSQILNASKNVGELTSNVGGCAKIVVPRAITEATINFIVTVVLLNIIGIYGALIGTVIAGIYRAIDSLLLTNNRVMHRPPYKNLKVLLINISLYTLIALTFNHIDLDVGNYMSFVFCGIILTIIFLILFSCVNISLNYPDVKMIKEIINSIIQRRIKKN